MECRNQLFGALSRSKNILVSSAMPNDLVDHRRVLQMVKKCKCKCKCPTDQEHSTGCRRRCVRDDHQDKTMPYRVTVIFQKTSQNSSVYSCIPLTVSFPLHVVVSISVCCLFV
ncbi:hypothetical protein COCON_G00150220 [Conger conger]|uniref:Uncharacterized protein n=1 Tax=Conger conger TaxID=82655 RepID=A0A9Q1HWS4_CONCO|nr:hypothetical protein COCON_G00150220 [Conger conger]